MISVCSQNIIIFMIRLAISPMKISLLVILAKVITCLKSTIKTPEKVAINAQSQQYDVEHISQLFLVFILLNLNS